MTVMFEFEGQPYSADVDGGVVVILRQMRRGPNNELIPMVAWEYPERVAGAVAIAREKAGLAIAATSAAADGSANSGAAGRVRSRGQRL